MSKKNRHIEHLTPELIRAYRNGELTREQQHEVERLMLENPLYEEALDGLEELTDEMLEADLSELNSRMDSLLEDNQKTDFWTIWRGIAAIIIFVLVATSIFFIQRNKPQPQTNKLLTNVKKEEAKDSLTNSNPSETKADSIEILLKPNEIKGNAVVADAKEEFVVDLAFEIDNTELNIEKIETDAKKLVIQALALRENDSLSLAIPMDKLNGRAERILTQPNLADALIGKVAGLSLDSNYNKSVIRSSPATRASTTEAKKRVISGTVTSEDDGLPLPMVMVLIKATTLGVGTDADGKYTLTDVPEGSTLVFRYLGYITQEVEAGNQKEINIRMSPDATSLGEIVVTGVAAAQPEKALSFSVSNITVAKPVTGYPEFNQYLKENLQYPEAAKTENIRGGVTVEFTIEVDGSLSNFEIIKGLGYGCDEEAIRLIKEGPQWQARTQGVNKTPIDSKVRIRIRFKPS